MRHSPHGRFRQQVDSLRQQFLQEGRLPFTEVLSSECVSEAVEEIRTRWKDRIFTPLVTLWVFLGQVLSADHSCRAAVARLIAHRVSQGLRPCSSETGAYCQARKRLPERFFSAVARLVGRNTGRPGRSSVAVERPPRLPVRRLDGLHARHRGEPQGIPSDLQSEAGYGRSPSRGSGPSFRSRVGRSSSWASAVMPGRAKASGAAAPVVGRASPRRRPVGGLLDVCNWTEMVMLKQRGVDCVCRLNKSHRTADFRRGMRLGKDDHIVKWMKPT